MVIKVPKGNGGERKLAPAGTHIARLIQVIDLGTQEKEWQGETKQQRVIRFGWELPLELAVFNPEKGEQPFFVDKDYTLSMGDRSTLRKDLEAWRGKPFSEAECDAIDFGKIIGKPCMLNLVHKQGQKSTFVNIASISPPPKGTTIPDQILPSIQYSAEDGQTPVYLSLPQWLQEKIAKSPEFQAAIGTDNGGNEGSEAGEGDDDSDSIPF